MFVTIDLADHYNNCATSTAERMHKGDMNGVGSSFPAAELPFGRASFLGVPYSLPPFGVVRNDNMEFERQQIRLPPQFYRSARIIGFSTNGSFREEIFFEAESSASVIIGLTDCYEVTPAFGDVEFVRCQCLHRKDGHILTSYKPCLWQQTVLLPLAMGKGHTIMFPDNPSMHLVALTLEVGP